MNPLRFGFKSIWLISRFSAQWYHLSGHWAGAIENCSR